MVIKKERDSNFELLRIVAMLAIIAHHFVGHSSIIVSENQDAPPSLLLYARVWGMWGKTAINSFVLISGYFLCVSQLTLHKYLKLVLEILFYTFAIMIIFGIIGYEPITIKLFLKSVLRLLMNIGRGFIPSFLVFYAFVPIYNKLLGALTEKELKKIIMGLIFVITCCSTFFFANVFFEPLWYATLYFIAAYIRLYPNKFTDSLWLSLGALVFSVMLAIMSVLLISYVQTMEIPFISGLQIYEFVVDSHKPLALVVGLSAFLVAKNCKPFKSRFINWLSAGTFGVLLIHDQSDTMRHWLWEDFVQVSQLYKMHSSWYWSNHDSSGFIVVSLVVPVIIFFICSCIDALRRKYIEKPMFLYFQKRKTNQNDEKYNK